MPTRKEVSKVKAQSIVNRKEAIDSKIASLQGTIYETILPDFLAIVKKNKDISVTELNRLVASLKSEFNKTFPSIMKDTVRASQSVGDLNLMYFSTLVESNRLDEIKNKTESIINKKLGIDSNGKLIAGGFIDKSIAVDSVQKEFVSSVKNLISTNSDSQQIQQKLKQIIVGTEEENGLIKRYYNTFAKDILNTIDRNNGVIYANELDLQHFYYFGGLIKTSRSFCLSKNGKIFSRQQAEKWKESEFIKKMYGKKISEYDPLTSMGGYGCLHTPDWITSELAKQNAKEQNAKAMERNQNFKDKNNL